MRLARAPTSRRSTWQEVPALGSAPRALDPVPQDAACALDDGDRRRVVIAAGDQYRVDAELAGQVDAVPQEGWGVAAPPSNVKGTWPAGRRVLVRYDSRRAR